MVDSIRRIEKFYECLSKLKKLSEYSKKQIMNDFLLADSVERNIQIAVEAVMDVARKIISVMGWKMPKSYKEVADILYEKGVIDKRLSEDVKELIGLRNVLVHLYADVKLDIILDGLEGYTKVLEKTMRKLIEFSKEKNISL
jgi:uncharacterized protein YutE (UPF0331/DUF86 family)